MSTNKQIVRDDWERKVEFLWFDFRVGIGRAVLPGFNSFRRDVDLNRCEVDLRAITVRLWRKLRKVDAWFGVKCINQELVISLGPSKVLNGRKSTSGIIKSRAERMKLFRCVSEHRFNGLIRRHQSLTMPATVQVRLTVYLHASL